jgi:hypothetical protein
MKTITLKNIKPKSSFVKVAEAAITYSRTNNALVRFAMGPANARQTFVASPKKPLATLVWEWSRSTAGLAVKKASRKAKATEIPAAV